MHASIYVISKSLNTVFDGKQDRVWSLTRAHISVYCSSAITTVILSFDVDYMNDYNIIIFVGVARITMKAVVISAFYRCIIIMCVHLLAQCTRKPLKLNNNINNKSFVFLIKGKINEFLFGFRLYLLSWLADCRLPIR